MMYGYGFRPNNKMFGSGGATPNPLWDGLLAYYTADNTPNDALGTYNGTLVNGATYGTGKINNGFSFDGINDYVNFGNNLDFSGLTPFSFNFWVFPNSATANQVFFGKWDGTGKGYLIRKDTTGNYLNFVISSGGTNYQSAKNTTISIPSSSFSMISLVFTNESIPIKIYINGVSDSITYIYDLFTTSASNTANLLSGSAIGSYFYSGKIDEVGVWNRQLTASEVTELYNSGSGLQYTP